MRLRNTLQVCIESAGVVVLDGVEVGASVGARVELVDDTVDEVRKVVEVVDVVVVALEVMVVVVVVVAVVVVELVTDVVVVVVVAVVAIVVLVVVVVSDRLIRRGRARGRCQNKTRAIERIGLTTEYSRLWATQYTQSHASTRLGMLGKHFP